MTDRPDPRRLILSQANSANDELRVIHRIPRPIVVEVEPPEPIRISPRVPVPNRISPRVSTSARGPVQTQVLQAQQQETENQQTPTVEQPPPPPAPPPTSNSSSNNNTGQPERTLSRFKQLVTTPQRQNKFVVEISKRSSNFPTERLSFKAEAIQMHSFEFKENVQIYRYGFGLPETFPKKPEYEPVTINFIVEEQDQDVLFGSIDGWINDIQKLMYDGNEIDKNIFTIGYKDDYEGEITIHSLSENGEITKTWKLFKAYPVATSFNPFAWTAEGYQNYIVRFMYYRISKP